MTVTTSRRAFLGALLAAPLVALGRNRDWKTRIGKGLYLRAGETGLGPHGSIWHYRGWKQTFGRGGPALNVEILSNDPVYVRSFEAAEDWCHLEFAP